jgi:hypothetical protein
LSGKASSILHGDGGGKSGDCLEESKKIQSPQLVHHHVPFVIE